MICFKPKAKIHDNLLTQQYRANRRQALQNMLPYQGDESAIDGQDIAKAVVHRLTEFGGNLMYLRGRDVDFLKNCCGAAYC